MLRDCIKQTNELKCVKNKLIHKSNESNMYFWYETFSGLFTNGSGMLWMGFDSEISWPEIKSIAGNDNGGDGQIMLRYFKRVAIFRNKL